MERPTSPTISVSRRGSAGGDPERTVLWLRGDHDLATKVTLAVAIARAAQLDDVPLLIDLSAVTFMDVSPVGVIVESRNRLRQRGQSLELRAPSPVARQVLTLCGLTDLIQRERDGPTDPAPALTSWVEVPPLEPAGRADLEGRPITGGDEIPPRRALAAADDEREEASADGVARGGP